jgi:hypothetical protein
MILVNFLENAEFLRKLSFEGRGLADAGFDEISEESEGKYPRKNKIK